MLYKDLPDLIKFYVACFLLLIFFVFLTLFLYIFNFLFKGTCCADDDDERNNDKDELHILDDEFGGIEMGSKQKGLFKNLENEVQI